MVGRLVQQLLSFAEVKQVIVTKNVPELLVIDDDERIEMVENSTRRGFGANHNKAFSLCRYPFFCVLNPDIELPGNPFPSLVRCAEHHDAAIVAPLILAPDGSVEDSVRHFPTLKSLFLKLLGLGDGRYLLDSCQESLAPDWVAGMFMLFRSADFAKIGGFDERYFLYYEDVDICDRIWRFGMKVVMCPKVSAIHDARRESHRSFRHLRWHLSSMGRYLMRSGTRHHGCD